MHYPFYAITCFGHSPRWINYMSTGHKVLYVVMVVVVLAAAYWKGKSARFPYTGTWVRPSHGTVGTSTIAFNKDGGCFVSSATNFAGKPQYEEFPCSYTMQGRQALLTTKTPNLTFKDGRVVY